MTKSSSATPGTAEPAHRELVVVAALLTGVAGGVTLIVTQSQLGLEKFAPIAQLWTIWAVLAAGLTFSFQQWAAINPVHRTSLITGRENLRVLIAITALVVALFVGCYVARSALFHSDAIVWPASAALLPVGTALNGVRRGELARVSNRTGLAAVIAGENLIRLAVTVALIVAGSGAGWFAIALLSGFAVVFGPVGGHDAVEGRSQASVATLGASAIAGFLAHAFMFGSPLLLTAAGGDSASVSALFLVLAGVRVPFVILQALVPQLAVSLDTAEDTAALASAVRRRIAIAAVGLGTIAAAAGWVLGDLVIGTVFGISGEVDRASYALLAAGSVLAACALIATVVLVVEGRSGRIVLAWGVPAVSAAVVTATGAVSDIHVLASWLLLVHVMVTAVAVAPGGEVIGRNKKSPTIANTTCS